MVIEKIPLKTFKEVFMKGCRKFSLMLFTKELKKVFNKMYNESDRFDITSYFNGQKIQISFERIKGK